jgi:hypothetical protein
VFFTASDAYLREFRVVVPQDCIASNTVEDNERSLTQMRQVLKADVRPSHEFSEETLRTLAAVTEKSGG